jgi:hypothetical protein
VRLGIYNASSSTDLPSTVLLDAGTISATATNTNYEITISQTLSAGIYWLAANGISVSGTCTFLRTGNTSNAFPVIGDGYSSPSTVNSQTAGFTESVNATSGFATAGTLTASNTPMVVWLKVA